jgi:cell division protein FtsB
LFTLTEEEKRAVENMKAGKKVEKTERRLASMKAEVERLNEQLTKLQGGEDDAISEGDAINNA